MRSNIPVDTIRAEQRQRIRATLLAFVDRNVQVHRPYDFRVTGTLKIDRQKIEGFVVTSRDAQSAAWFTTSQVSSITTGDPHLIRLKIKREE